MGRFYQTVDSNFINDGIYNPDYDAVGKLLLHKQQQLNELETGLKSLYDINFNYLTSDAEKENAKNIQQYYNNKVDTLISKIQKDPANSYKYKKELDSLKREMVYDYTRGNIAKIQGSYNAYQLWLQENAELCKKDPVHCENMKREALNRWGGNSILNSWAQERMLPGLDTERLEKTIRERVANIMSEATVTNQGYIYRIGNKEMKFLSEQEIEDYVISDSFSNPNVKAYLNQAHRVGTMRLFDKDGNFDLYDPEKTYKYIYLDKNTGRPAIGKRQALNMENDLAKYIRARQFLAYSQVNEKVDIKDNNYALTLLKSRLDEEKEIRKEERERARALEQNVVLHNLNLNAYTLGESKAEVNKHLNNLRGFAEGNLPATNSSVAGLVEEMYQTELKLNFKDINAKVRKLKEYHKHFPSLRAEINEAIKDIDGNKKQTIYKTQADKINRLFERLAKESLRSRIIVQTPYIDDTTDSKGKVEAGLLDRWGLSFTNIFAKIEGKNYGENVDLEKLKKRSETDFQVSFLPNLQRINYHKMNSDILSKNNSVVRALNRYGSHLLGVTKSYDFATPTTKEDIEFSHQLAQIGQSLSVNNIVIGNQAFYKKDGFVSNSEEYIVNTANGKMDLQKVIATKSLAQIAKAENLNPSSPVNTNNDVLAVTYKVPKEILAKHYGIERDGRFAELPNNVPITISMGGVDSSVLPVKRLYNSFNTTNKLFSDYGYHGEIAKLNMFIEDVNRGFLLNGPDLQVNVHNTPFYVSAVKKNKENGGYMVEIYGVKENGEKDINKKIVLGGEKLKDANAIITALHEKGIN